MKQAEAITIAHTRHLSEQAPPAPEGGLDADGTGDAAQIDAVEVSATEDGTRENERGKEDVEREVVFPIEEFGGGRFREGG